ncbi:FkbM family methyltransferase [Gemmobacter denitrificans]|uniref:FkbM family methyltransferase n=1 Tax=Gemmobacter denitrificans TaxID=3123040 RepID=A0ABU8BXN9_9RHOB
MKDQQPLPEVIPPQLPRLDRLRFDRPRQMVVAARDLLMHALQQACGGRVSYVQVGAHDGVLADPVHQAALAWGWSGLLIEPHPGYFAALGRNHASNPRMRLVNCAISDVPAMLDLYHPTETAVARLGDYIRGSASLDAERLRGVLERRAARQGLELMGDEIASTAVTVRRLDGLLAETGLADFDLLVIDAEGHEREVLRSFDLSAHGIRAAIVECNQGDMQHEAEYAAMLRAAGFTVLRVHSDLFALHPGRLALSIDQVLMMLGLPQAAGSGD